MDLLNRAEKFMVGILANSYAESDNGTMVTQAFEAAEAFEAEAKKRGFVNAGTRDRKYEFQYQNYGQGESEINATGSLGTENRQNPIKPQGSGPVLNAIDMLIEATRRLQNSTHNAAPYAIAKINEAMELLDPDANTYFPPTDHE